jgi:hypothetical protein
MDPNLTCTPPPHLTHPLTFPRFVDASRGTPPLVIRHPAWRRAGRWQGADRGGAAAAGWCGGWLVSTGAVHQRPRRRCNRAAGRGRPPRARQRRGAAGAVHPVRVQGTPPRRRGCYAAPGHTTRPTCASRVPAAGGPGERPLRGAHWMAHGRRAPGRARARREPGASAPPPPGRPGVVIAFWAMEYPLKGLLACRQAPRGPGRRGVPPGVCRPCPPFCAVCPPAPAPTLHLPPRKTL